MVEAIIFDFDGTLADTLPALVRAFQDVFWTCLGRRLSEEDVYALFGPTEEVILRTTFGDRYEDARRLFFAAYGRYQAQSVTARPDLERLLTFLECRRVPTALVTNKGAQTLSMALDHLGWPQRFAVRITGDQMRRPKPDPDGIVQALAALRVLPERAIYVGDSAVDVMAGRRAGTLTAQAMWFRQDRAAVGAD